MTTHTATLADFLLARIVEDEAAARACVPGPWMLSKEVDVRGNGGRNFVATTTGAVSSGNAAHIARHDPARVLAECKAKRAIVERYVDTSYIDPTPSNAYDLALFHVMCALALPYADHEDYREEWRL